MIQNIDYVLEKLSAVVSDPSTPEPIKDWITDLVRALVSPLAPSLHLQKGSALAQSTGGMADQYAEARAARLALEKVAEKAKERETELYKLILANLSNSPDTGAAGEKYRVQMTTKTRNNVENWEQLHGFVRLTGDFSLLQKRLSDTAVKDYAEANDGRLPEGVKAVDVDTLSFSKVK